MLSRTSAMLRKPVKDRYVPHSFRQALETRRLQKYELNARSKHSSFIKYCLAKSIDFKFRAAMSRSKFYRLNKVLSINHILCLSYIMPGEWDLVVSALRLMVYFASLSNLGR